MARTHASIERQFRYSAQIPRLEHRRQLARFAAGSGVLVSAGAIVDSFSHAAITKFYDHAIFDSLGRHISTGNLQATRLPVAALYAVSAVIFSVHANRHQNHINTLGLLAAQEEQADRHSTALELSTGQRTLENARLANDEQAPMFSQLHTEQSQ